MGLLNRIAAGLQTLPLRASCCRAPMRCFYRAPATQKADTAASCRDMGQRIHYPYPFGKGVTHKVLSIQKGAETRACPMSVVSNSHLTEQEVQDFIK